MPGIRHIVTLTFQDDTTSDQLDQIATRLRELPGRIDALRSYVVGLDLGRSDGNAAAAVVADFDDWAGYETYRDHPDHVAVIQELILPILAGRSAVQHELP